MFTYKVLPSELTKVLIAEVLLKTVATAESDEVGGQKNTSTVEAITLQLLHYTWCQSIFFGLLYTEAG